MCFGLVPGLQVEKRVFDLSDQLSPRIHDFVVSVRDLHGHWCSKKS